MSLGHLQILAHLAVFCVRIAVLLFLIAIIMAIVGRFSPSWRIKFSKYHPKIGWIALILILIHAIFFTVYVTLRGRPSFPIFGLFTLVGVFLFLFSGLMLFIKIRDPKVPLPIKKRYRYIHISCIALVFVLLSLHVYELRHPVVKAKEEYKFVPRVQKEESAHK